MVPDQSPADGADVDWGAMWHLSLENEMFRLVSFVALACLSLAATALLTAPKSTVHELPPEENNTDASNRLAAQSAERTASFHARFSLN